jgi:hypothetical protein
MIKITAEKPIIIRFFTVQFFIFISSKPDEPTKKVAALRLSTQ